MDGTSECNEVVGDGIGSSRLCRLQGDGTNCHAMSINGKQSNITDDDLLEIGARYSIGTAESILDEIKNIFDF